MPEHQTLWSRALLGSSSEVINMQEYLHDQRGAITAWERQDLCRMYLAHHELKSNLIIIHRTTIVEMVRLVMCRLDMLGRLCTTWHGWVSAAVYLPLDPQSYSTHVHAAVARLDQLHADLEPGQPNLTETVDTVVKCLSKPGHFSRKLSKGPAGTPWIWNLCADAHDFDSHTTDLEKIFKKSFESKLRRSICLSLIPPLPVKNRSLHLNTTQQ